MSERAVFLDRDNTIIENDAYLGDPSKVKLLPGAAAALASLRALGYRLIVVSNQSGVARGMFTEADVESVNDEMARQLREQGGAYIDASYYCPYHPDAPLPDYRIDHEWRKPKPGMLKQAAVDFHLDLAQSWMIGDMGRDIAAGAAAGCRTILLRDADRGSGTAEAEGSDSVTPGFVVKSLADAARIIAREGRSSPAVQKPEPAKTVEVPVPPTPAAPPSPIAAPTPMPVQQPPAVSPRTEYQPPLPSSPTPIPPPLAPAMTESTGRLEKSLEELVFHMRKQSRAAELRPDFSFSAMAAILLQAFAIIALVIGLANHFTAKATFNVPADQVDALISRISAAVWVLVSVTLQGMVIALLLYARNKHET